MAERQSTPSGAPNREGGVSTFSFQVGNPTSLARPVSQGAPMRGGVAARGDASVQALDHGGVARAGAMAQRDLDTIMKFGSEGINAVGEKLQKSQDAAYWEGVKKAATGMSIKEILDEQPWYSQIFGDAPMVEGARAYTSQAHLDKALGDLAANMPELAKQSPEAVTQTFIGALDAMMTGDTMTDAVLKRSASEKLPLLLKQHAKEHYAYLQSNLRSTQFESWQPVASGLQAQAAGFANGTVSAGDWSIIQNRALASIAPLDGQTEEAYKSNVLALYGKAAQDGNFHMVKLMDEAGVRQFFTPEEQKTVDDQVYRYGQRAKQKFVSENMAEDVAALQAVARTNPENTKEIARISRLMNDRFRKATGIDEDVIDVARTTETAAVTLFNDAQRGLTAQQKKESAMANTGIAFSAGYGASAYADTGLSKTEADSVFRTVYGQSKDQMKFLVDNATLAPEPFVSPSIAGEIRATVAGSIRDQWNPGMENAYNNWKKMASTPNGGEATASAYFGSTHAQFAALDNLVQRGTPVDIAYDRVFNKPVPPSPELTKTNRQALEQGIRSINQYDGWKSVFTWAGVRPLSDTGIRGVTAVLAPKFDQYMQMNPDADPASTASWVAKAALAAGELEMYGDYAWGKQPNQVPMSQYVGPVKEWVSEAVETTISAKLKAQGATSVDDYTIWRGADANGDPIIYVQALTDGDMHNVIVRGSEVKALYDSNLKTKKGSEFKLPPAAAFPAF